MIDLLKNNMLNNDFLSEILKKKQTFYKISKEAFSK